MIRRRKASATKTASTNGTKDIQLKDTGYVPYQISPYAQQPSNTANQTSSQHAPGGDEYEYATGTQLDAAAQNDISPDVMYDSALPVDQNILVKDTEKNNKVLEGKEGVQELYAEVRKSNRSTAGTRADAVNQGDPETVTSHGTTDKTKAKTELEVMENTLYE